MSSLGAYRGTYPTAKKSSYTIHSVKAGNAKWQLEVCKPSPTAFQLILDCDC